MKINLVLPHQLPFPPTRGGGVENLNWLLALEFVRRGHQVVAYSRAAEGLAVSESDARGIRHVRVKGYDRHPNRWLDHFNGLRFARHLRPVLEPADVTTFHTPFSFLLRYKRGIGVCAHTIHRTPKWPVPLYRGLDRVYCGSDAVVTQAQSVDHSIHNLKRVYNCIDATVLPSVAPPAGRAGLHFLYVGRFVEDKGMESLIKGFELALRDFPESRLQTLGPQVDEAGGNTDFFNRMSRYLVQHGLERKVEFLPPVFDKTRLNTMIVAADVVCVPSLSGETFSMAILEAMALGKPVLVSDFSPMPEAVDHELTGYVARAGDAGSIAEGMRFFSAHRDRLAMIGARGLEKVRRCFSVEKIGGEYLEDFEALVAARKGARGSMTVSTAL